MTAAVLPRLPRITPLLDPHSQAWNSGIFWSDFAPSYDSPGMQHKEASSRKSTCRSGAHPFLAEQSPWESPSKAGQTGRRATRAPSHRENDLRTRQLVKIHLESHAHPALKHVWLEDVAARRCPDMASTLRDFARDYYAYSSGFPLYLRKLITKLGRSDHRELLERNLLEEQGGIDPEDRDRLRAAAIDTEDVEGRPHPELFQRFCHALGLEAAEFAPAQGPGQVWRQHMLEFLEDASPAAAVGALGPGTEGIVQPIYRKLLRGIRQLDGLAPRDYVFFELHCTVDDQHGLDLQRVAHDLLDAPGAHHDMRRGMLEALRLRQNFFGHQQLRSNARIMGMPT